MTTRPVIPDATARQAVEVLRGIMEGEFDPDDRGVNQRRMAAEALVRLHLAELRWSPQEVDRLAAGAGASQDVRDLAALTPASLEALRERMAAGFPGKRSKPS